MMNLKYYLRGLGIGVVVTALIMGILAGKREILSDEEIIERAKALGMTQESGLRGDTLASYEEEVQEETDGDGLPLPDEEEEAEPEPEEEALKGEESGEGQALLEEENPEPDLNSAEDTQPNQESAETEEADVAQEVPASEDDGAFVQGEDTASGSEAIPAPGTEEENVTIEIKSGDSSYSICQKLEEAGLVETATALDRYLFENGYDKRINTGVFEIPRDADMEKIAKIISRME